MADTAADALVGKIEGLFDGFSKIEKGLADLDKKVEERSKVQVPAWLSGNGPGVIVGESPNGSRPFSVLRLAKGMMSGHVSDDVRENCKLELQFARNCGAAYGCGTYAIPMSGRHVNTEDPKQVSLAKEWSQMQSAQPSIDVDQYQLIVKTLTAGSQTAGGSFVAPPSVGDMIDLLRNVSLWDQIPGIRSVPLPPSGKILFPSVTSGVTISSYVESDATSPSTPGTGQVEMEAKKYAGLVKMTEEWLKFATSVEGDAFARQQIALDSQLKMDRDLIDGPGGKSIKGFMNYTGITTHTATTTGANGDTLEPEDIDLLLAIMADASVPTNGGVFVAMRNKLWAALKHREDSQGRKQFDAAAIAYGGGRLMQLYSGNPIYTSNQIPATRRKGSGTNLTSVLAGVPSEIYIGRAGAMEMSMTNSDGTDFTTGTIALRGVQWADATLAHEVSFGMIDVLLQS